MAEKTGNDPQKQRDFDDLQHEMSGIDNGRMKRFLGENQQSIEAKRKKEAAREAQTRLMMLLADPVYRERYNLVLSRLDQLEQAADRALLTLEEQISEARTNLEDIQANAARLPDGTRVYRDANGAIRREDGSEVDETLAATIVWRGDEPTYESFADSDATVSKLEEEHDEVSGFRNDVLGGARNRIEDHENPPSLNDLDDILNGIEANIPDAVAIETGLEDQIAPSAELTASMIPNVPFKNQ